MASSLPQFYTDFSILSGEISPQFHASSSCNDIDSTLSIYLNECYGSFNTSSKPESIFVPQAFGISEFSIPECNNYYQQMSLNNPTKPALFRSATEEQSLKNSERGMQAAEPITKVGRYSVEERKNRIMKYLKKKNQRNFSKTIKYVCRKTLADRRVRVRGRFARNNDTCEQQSPMSNNHNYNSEDMFYLIQQMEHDDGWLQEAISNLITFPCEFDVPEDAHHSNTWSF